jgi:hypothetical protein
VDYQKAFDSIETSAILRALQNQGIEKPYIKTLRYIYSNATSTIKLHKYGDPFPIQRGICQGDSISPKLFTATLEEVFRNLDWRSGGININGEKISHLKFADDIVLIAETLADLKKRLNELNQVSVKIGLRMNMDKTKIMTNQPSQIITINGKELEFVYSYVYLGQLMSLDGNQKKEIDRRIQLGWMAFGRMKNVFRGEIPIGLKRRAFEQCILPVLTYGGETWTLTESLRGRLAATQHKMERSMLGISLLDRKTNIWIRARTKVTDIVESIK